MNQIKAAKKLIFGVCKEYIGVRKVAPPLQGFSVDLCSVVELIVREQRLHKVSLPTLQLMLKLDGRPFWGNVHVIVSCLCILNYSYCLSNLRRKFKC